LARIFVKSNKSNNQTQTTKIRAVDESVASSDGFGNPGPQFLRARKKKFAMVFEFMNKRFIELIVLAQVFGAFTPGYAQTKSAENSGPKIQFAQPIFDFGKVQSGEVVKHSFVFTNTGAATLEILDVKPGCGCTTAGTWDKSIAPGKTGSIPLQLNSTGFGGKVAKSATVTCNDPAQSNVVLQITGTVWKAIDITPTMAVFNVPADAPTNETKSIRIVSNLEEPVTLSEPVWTNQSIRAELKTVRPGKEFELLVTAIPPFNAPFISTPIKIKTSAKEMPEISTSAYLTVLQPLSVLPQQIWLPAGPVSSNLQLNVTIRNNTTNALTLSDPKANVPGANVSFKESQPGRLFNLSLNLPDGFETQAGQAPEVTVKSSHPKQPLIRIPITQAAKPANNASTARLVPQAPKK
jgi:hypothetical protein